MPGRPRTRLLVLAVALSLAGPVAGCGGDDGGEKIPPADASAMLDTATEIEQATATQDCEEAQTATTTLRDQVEALPEETDPEISDALDQMVSRLDEELDAECAETGTTEPETTTTDTTVPPETTTSIPEETEPTAPEPAPEEEEEEPPAEEPPGQGGGGPPATPPGQSGGGAPPTGGTEDE